MNIRKFWLLAAILCLSAILLVSTAGCRGVVASEGAAKKEAAVEEKPDKELFDKYFPSIDLGGSSFGPRTHSSAFGDGAEENICILLPHQEAWLGVGFKNKKNFIFRIAVLDLETNDSVERCARAASSEGSDGFFMEALEWAFLRPGNYEYGIYVEDKLAVTLPFEVLSYGDYFGQRLDEIKSYIVNFFENLGEKNKSHNTA